MRDGIPSLTASCAAFARAAASCRPMTSPAIKDEDDASLELLSPSARRFVPRGRMGQLLARAASLGLVDHIALRTAAIDDVLAPRFAQIVILGAGLDARAYRLASLSNARIFEVDHPASQAAKIARARALPPRCRALHHVAVDFASGDLDGALAASGHDAAVATAWVLEGVTLYLTESVTSALLAQIARRSAAGSLLAMTYMRPPEHPLPPIVRGVLDRALARLGEPLRAPLTADAIAAMLRAVGLTPRSDTSSTAWASRFGASARLARVFRAERLVVADRLPLR